MGGCSGTAECTVYAPWAFQGNRSRATIMGWEVEFGRQITQICRNPAFVHAVARRIAWEDLSSTFVWGIILGSFHKQDKCRRVLIMKASCCGPSKNQNLDHCLSPVKLVAELTSFRRNRCDMQPLCLTCLCTHRKSSREGSSKNKPPVFDSSTWITADPVVLVQRKGRTYSNLQLDDYTLVVVHWNND